MREIIFFVVMGRLKTLILIFSYLFPSSFSIVLLRIIF